MFVKNATFNNNEKKENTQSTSNNKISISNSNPFLEEANVQEEELTSKEIENNSSNVMEISEISEISKINEIKKKSIKKEILFIFIIL